MYIILGVSKTVYDNLDAPIGRFYMAGKLAWGTNTYLHHDIMILNIIIRYHNIKYCNILICIIIFHLP